ncbi:MAG: ATP-binding protein [archaeon]|nr:ATP-binding protein [archaeon]
MLTRITVQGLFNEIDYDIQLKDGVLTYLHAQNGYGKSTVMKLVFNILQGNLEDVRTTAFGRLDLYFDDNSKLIVKNINEELTILMKMNRIEEEVDQEHLCEILGTTYISPERLYGYDDNGNLVPAIDLYMKELSEGIAKAVRDSDLKPAKDDGKEYTEADLDMMFKNIDAKVNFIKQAGFQPSVPHSLRFPPTRFEIGERKKEYRNLALSLKAYVDHYYQYAESIVVYMDIVNALFVNKTIELNNKGFLQARMDKSGTVIPISKFSSGEKQILIIFYLLLFKTAPGSLAIIDEPEVSLHVSWQQMLGKYLKDVARVRDLRLIVSTHSPSIIHDDWDLALELSETRTN